MSGIITQNVLDSSGLIKAVAAGGTWVEIKSLTASADATLSFVNGAADVVLDSTYPVYCFKFTNMHPATDDVEFMFNGSDDTSSHSYDITKTTNYFYAANFEGAGTPTVAYEAGRDLAQSTGFKELAGLIGNAADECASGYLYLFAPSDTTFAKHFLVRTHCVATNYAVDGYIGGYFNTTSAIDAIQFKMASGTIESSKIKLFGIKDS